MSEDRSDEELIYDRDETSRLERVDGKSCDFCRRPAWESLHLVEPEYGDMVQGAGLYVCERHYEEIPYRGITIVGLRKKNR